MAKSTVTFTAGSATVLKASRSVLQAAAAGLRHSRAPISRFKALTWVVAILALLSGLQPSLAQKPILPDFHADPSARVFNGKVYIYPSHDAPGATNWQRMVDWHVFSSGDLTNWTDHGVAFGLKDISWAKKEAWAADCIGRNGRYYFYFTAGGQIGVAVSDSPTGPFKDALGEPLVKRGEAGIRYMIDPCIYLDDDGQAYLYVGGGRQLGVVKLKTDMITRDGPIQILDLPEFYEGVWVHKRNGIYYASYPTRPPKGNANVMVYSMAKSPLGPFEFKGAILDNRSGNVHGSITEFKSRWYLFYHVAGSSTWERRVCVEPLFYNEDGTIKPIQMSKRRTRGGPDKGDKTNIFTETAPTARIARFDGDRAAAISYTFDDNTRDQFTVGVPMLDEVGFKGTFFVIPGATVETVEKAEKKKSLRRAWGSITWSELKEMSGQGHEIASHTWSHPNLTRLPPEEVDAQLRQAHDAIKTRIGQPPLTLAFPFNASTPEVRAAALKYHVACRTYQTAISSKSTVESLNAWADTLVKDKKWGVIMAHAIGSGYSALNDPEILRAHLKHVKSRERDIWVDTFAKIARYERERDDAKLTVSGVAGNMTCVLTSTLDPQLYDMPLTIVIDAKGVTSARAERDGKELPTRAGNGSIYLQATPSLRPITITWKQSE